MSLANEMELREAKHPKEAGEEDEGRYLFKCRDCVTYWVDSSLEWMEASVARHQESNPNHRIIKTKILGLANGEEYVPPR